MIEITGNLWDHHPDSIIGITTNGFVKTNGECVMGRGCAQEARDRFPGIARQLGDRIKESGNITHFFERAKIVTIPVKHNWYEKADIELIKGSLCSVKFLTDQYDWKKVVIPRPGCGNGQLDWQTEVRSICENLDDRFYFITF